jgi:hypothetical protein
LGQPICAYRKQRQEKSWRQLAQNSQFFLFFIKKQKGGFYGQGNRQVDMQRVRPAKFSKKMPMWPEVLP